MGFRHPKNEVCRYEQLGESVKRKERTSLNPIGTTGYQIHATQRTCQKAWQFEFRTSAGSRLLVRQIHYYEESA